MPAHRVSILWFRKDLRLHDQSALARAVAESELVIPVFVFDQEECRPERMGPFRRQFLHESVKDLRAAMRERGADLLVYYGNTPEIIAHLCERYQASAIYYSEEYAPEEQKGEQLLAQRVTASGVQMVPCDTGSLIDKQYLPFPISRLPFMFTDFRKAVEPLFSRISSIPAPERIAIPADLEQTVLQDPDTVPEKEPRAVLSFSGGEGAALARLHYYIDSGCAHNYFETRNGMIGGDYSTKFSPWLACGCLSPRLIYEAIKSCEAVKGANKSTYWILFELLWRDFFRRCMQRYGARYFFPGGISGNARLKSNNPRLWEQWCTGNTPDEFVNAHMHELNATGFMSNRGRQIVASYLVNDLGLDWRKGAAYFERMLIDYDVYSNYGNWTYIAGVGNDPRPQRYFNPQKQATQYDADGSFRKLWAKSNA